MFSLQNKPGHGSVALIPASFKFVTMFGGAYRFAVAAYRHEFARGKHLASFGWLWLDLDTAAVAVAVKVLNPNDLAFDDAINLANKSGRNKVIWRSSLRFGGASEYRLFAGAHTDFNVFCDEVELTTMLSDLSLIPTGSYGWYALNNRVV